MSRLHVLKTTAHFGIGGGICMQNVNMVRCDECGRSDGMGKSLISLVSPESKQGIVGGVAGMVPCLMRFAPASKPCQRIPIPLLRWARPLTASHADAGRGTDGNGTREPAFPMEVMRPPCMHMPAQTSGHCWHHRTDDTDTVGVDNTDCLMDGMMKEHAETRMEP